MTKLSSACIGLAVGIQISMGYMAVYYSAYMLTPGKVAGRCIVTFVLLAIAWVSLLREMERNESKKRVKEALQEIRKNQREAP